MKFLNYHDETLTLLHMTMTSLCGSRFHECSSLPPCLPPSRDNPVERATEACPGIYGSFLENDTKGFLLSIDGIKVKPVHSLALTGFHTGARSCRAPRRHLRLFRVRNLRGEIRRTGFAVDGDKKYTFRDIVKVRPISPRVSR